MTSTASPALSLFIKPARGWFPAAQQLSMRLVLARKGACLSDSRTLEGVDIITELADLCKSACGPAYLHLYLPGSLTTAQQGLLCWMKVFNG